ncbi:MAG TPA: exonuclease SbcCD subunit D [Trebonia sp.]|nr:exonuclease SbcCD subunit D [Trebonia sp.]
MRFLHTSDWHLGRSLHRTDLRDAQTAFLDHLVEMARAEKVDAVLVAGDIYDRAVPSVDAVALCEDALFRLRGTGARVILISGNHDSARRLGFSSSLIDAAGVHLRTRPSALADPVMLEDDHGSVAVYGVPYLEPAFGVPGQDKAGDQGDQNDAPCAADADAGPAPARGHAAVLGGAARLIQADAASRGVARTVVMAHGWVHGGAASDSERDISVGGIGHVPASVFNGFSYVALGHLHGQQTIAEHMRYSGSPLPYSFSEAAHKKGCWLVEIGASGQVRAERVPAPVYRRLTLLSGRLDELLSAPEYDEHQGDFLAVTLTDTQRPDRAMDRLRARFPHVLTLEFKPAGVLPDGRRYGEKVAGKDDLAIASEFIQHVRDGAPTAAEQQLLAAAFEAAREGVR